MWISELQLLNIKAFADSGPLQLSKRINVVVGRNNAGKSTLLHSLLCMQAANQQHLFTQAREARRIGTPESSIRIRLKDIDAAYFNTPGIEDGTEGEVTIAFAADSLPREFPYKVIGTNSASIPAVKPITNQEPDNFIFPYTVRRFAQYYNNLTSNNPAQQKYVLDSLAQLADKIHPFTQSSNEFHEQFDKLCRDLIGSYMGIIEGPNGHIPGIYAGRNAGSIPLLQMGDGVPHIVGLIINLLKAEKKLFVIEELENSINPEPLKLLLEEIKRSAREQYNQFIISTHSNIVLQSLASEEESTIIEVTQAPATPRGIPTSTCTPIERNDIEARRRVLMSLGYALADNDMYDGWLILEESSAATIIHKFLIPYFAPKLEKVLGIIDSKGYNQVTNQFLAIAHTFLYLHLTPIYTHRVWVIIDGGKSEQDIIDQLRRSFPTWPSEHFDQFSEHNFEMYYPSFFHEEVERVLHLPTHNDEEKRTKQQEKHKLRENLMEWIDKDPDRAVEAFTSSAAEVITKLKAIESKLAENAR